ncbi:kinase-like domain-containing protein, partial [Dissophora ornata]
MGIIHVAEWRGVKVAIKEASPQVISKEVEIYTRMRGVEGVVQFYGVTYPPGLDKLCIVTKYAENGSLSWHLKVSFNKLTWDDKIMLASQIAFSVSRLHKEGIFHRDLHGGNILIDEAGNALLTDFGASKVMEDRVVRSMDEFAISTLTTPEGKSKFVSQMVPDMTNIGNSNAVSNRSRNLENTANANQQQADDGKPHDPLIGVMAYIAPERFRNPRYFDARCDIYSLGVLLWELTSGHSAFAKMPQDVQLAVSILNGKREQPIEGTPEKYQALYELCWDSDPNKRPSLDDILLALSHIRAGLTDEQLAVTRERNQAYYDTG